MRKALGLGLLLGALLLAGCGQDTVKPSVTITAPQDGATVNQDTLTVQGTAQDNVRVNRITYQLNNGQEQEVPITPGTSVNFAFTLTLQQGQNTITVHAYDQANNKGSATVQVTYDPTPAPDTQKPTITITQPQDGSTVNTPQVTVQGSAQDNTQVARITYQLNGGQEQQITITPGPNVSFQFQVTLQQGQNTITVHAYDQANNKGSATVQVTYDPTAVHNLSGTVVSEYAGGPVAGSTLKLYKNGNLVATTLSGADGSFSFGTLAPGTYRLEAQKPGMAGSVLEGIRVPEMTSVTLIQRQAFDATATTTPPTLLITQDGTQSLEGGTFTNTIPFRVQVDTTKDYVRPMRYIYVALGRTPGSAFITNSATWTRQVFSNVEDTGNRALSGANVAGFGSASGETVYVEVVAYDFNLNRSHYLIPITFKNTSANQNNNVSSPTRVAATAITLSRAVGFFSVKSPTTLKVPVAKGTMGELTLDPEAVPEGSNLYVEVRWCYTATATPFAFDIERSTDGTNWTRVGTVGGARSSSCPDNPLDRPFFFRDASPDLTPGQTYYYRVVARGANRAESQR
ncbi:Ig-like domain-containing protein [Thermus parvatiensis]|uniref:Ig-like domain-containing protein n=1 Tax=Thermus parvatiensis TaxID=456163 RepID=UPI0002EEC472|nr:Ig-like domain-containing protein [Thermus parvatiensis]